MSVFKKLRVLIRWMVTQGYRSFADLDRDASERFMAVIAQRPGKAPNSAVKSVTCQGYANLLVRLYQQGEKWPDVAIADPFAGNPPPFRRHDRGWLPYTPDSIAVFLVSAALRLIGVPADDVIALQSRAQAVYDEALANGMPQTKAGFIVNDALVGTVFSCLPGEDSPWYDAPVTSTKQIHFLVDRIYEACFVVISYLVGARVSEILSLRVACIEKHAAGDGNERFTYLVGQIYKTSREHGGETHRWIAPAPVERAVAVMTQLTARLRALSGRDTLFLSMGSSGLVGPDARVTVPVVSTLISRLNGRFAPFIRLPLHDGQPWHLNTHQGRKTFARFVGKRDRTGLHALQVHFGHVTRVMTDRGYVGTDFSLDDLIDRHAQEETRAALEAVVTATSLAGKGGRMIATRSRFRGRTREGDVQAYVRFLMEETDLRLGVCDWGYCVYRHESAACLGNEKGPNLVLRTESTCLSCPNFVVTDRHKRVWQSRRDRNRALLEQKGLDLGSRELAERRVAECECILAELDERGGTCDGT